MQSQFWVPVYVCLQYVRMENDYSNEEEWSRITTDLLFDRIEYLSQLLLLYTSKINEENFHFQIKYWTGDERERERELRNQQQLLNLIWFVSFYVLNCSRKYNNFIGLISINWLIFSNHFFNHSKCLQCPSFWSLCLCDNIN